LFRYKEEINERLFQETKHMWEIFVFEYETYKHPRFVLPYTGWSPDTEGYATVSTYFYYEKGKLLKSYGRYGDGYVYDNYNGFEWIRDIRHKPRYNFDDPPYKLSYSKRPLGKDMYSPYHKKYDYKNPECITNERIEILIGKDRKCDFSTFRYIYKDGKKVYQIRKGKVFRVKRKKIGIQPGRTRMQVIKEKFIPVSDEEKINFRTLPEWMKEDIDDNNDLFDKIKAYIN